MAVITLAAVAALAARALCLLAEGLVWLMLLALGGGAAL